MSAHLDRVLQLLHLPQLSVVYVALLSKFKADLKSLIQTLLLYDRETMKTIILFCHDISQLGHGSLMISSTMQLSSACTYQGASFKCDELRGPDILCGHNKEGVSILEVLHDLC